MRADKELSSMEGFPPMRVLCVAAEAGLGAVIRERLGRLGHAATVAATGEEGLAACVEGRADVVVLDCGAGGTAGLEMLRKLAVRDMAPPVVVLIGQGSEGLALEAMQAGAEDYVIKDEAGIYLELLSGTLERARRYRLLEDAKARSEDALAREAAFQRAFGEIANGFIGVSLARIDEGIARGLAVIGDFAGADRSYIIRFDFASGVARNTHEWCRAGIAPQIDNLQAVPMAAFKWAIDRLLELETVFVPMVADLPPEAGVAKAEFEAEGIQSLLVVPLVSEGVLVGTVGLDFVLKARSCTESEIRLLRLSAATLSNALSRQKAERALRESEERYRHFFDNALVGLYRAKISDGLCVDINATGAEQLGLSIEEIVGKVRTADLYRDPDLRSELVSRLKQAGCVHGFEVDLRLHGGRDVTFSVLARAYPDEDYIEGAVIDITQRKRAEAALRESEARLRLLVENMGDMVSRHLADSTVTYVSPSCESATGYTPAELLDTRSADLVHPEDIESTLAVIGGAASRQDDHYRVQHRLRRKDGTYFWVETVGRLIYGAEGELCEIQCNVRDIIDRKQAEESLRESEERFRAVFETAADAIFLKDTCQRYTQANPATEQYFGIAASELLGRTTAEIFGEDVSERVSEVDARVLAGEIVDEEDSSPVDGSTMSFRMIKVPLRDKHGKIVGLAGIARDVTAHKRAEKELASFNEAMVGREERILDMKRQVNALSAELGRAAVYDEAAGAEDALEARDAGEGAGHAAEEVAGRLAAVLDVKALEPVLKSFCSLVGIATGIADLDGNVLLSANWQRVCTDFHRVNRETCARCIESDTFLVNQVKGGKANVIHECRNGMLDAASPILIGGQHIANAFVGQFHSGAPDLEKFRAQAAEFGFEEEDYLCAVREAPVIPAEKLPAMLAFLTSVAEVSAAMGRDRLHAEAAMRSLKRKQADLKSQRRAALNLLEDTRHAADALRESEERWRSLTTNTKDLVQILDTEGKILYMNRVYPPHTLADVIGKSVFDFTEDAFKEATRKSLDGLLAGKGPQTFETSIRVSDSASAYFEVKYVPILTEGKVERIISLVTDISGKRESEQALRESEARFRALVENIPQRIFLKDGDSVFVAVNEHFAGQLGLSPEDVAGKTDLDFFPRDLAEKYRADDRKVMASGALMDTEEEYVEDGERNFVQTVKVPVRDSGGAIIGIFGIFWDITERKEAEEERLAHLRFLENLDRIDETILGSTDLDEMMEQVLDTVLAIFECDRAWLLYPCDPDAPTWSVPMERNRPEYPGAFARDEMFRMEPETAEGFRQLLEAGKPLTGEMAEGEAEWDPEDTYHVRSSMSMAIRPRRDLPWDLGLHQCSRSRTWSPEEQTLFKEIGRRIADALGSLLLLRDLRDREERFALAMEANRDGLWDWKVSTDEVYYSPGYAAMLGYSPSEVAGDVDSWVDLMHPEDREAALEANIACVENRRDDFSAEFRMRAKNGAWIWILSRGKAVARDETGQATRMIGTHTDITERKRAEEVFQSLVRSTVGITGAECFTMIARELCTCFGANCGIVGALADGGDAGAKRVRVLAMILDGEAVPDLEFSVRGTPCERVLEDGYCVYSHDICSLFPDDRGLVQLKAEAYVGVPIFNKTGNSIGILGAVFRKAIEEGREWKDVMDILSARASAEIERERVEKEKLALERQVQHAQKLESLGVLAGGIAHDFNNILAAVLGYADLAISDLGETHPALSSVREVVAGANRAAELTRQMLAYSGRGKFVVQQMDVSALMDDMAHLLRTSIPRSTTLNLNLGRSLPPIRADASQMQQIVMNLITNASEAIGQENGAIILATGQSDCDEAFLARNLSAPASSEHTPLPGTYVFFEVSDTGCGMDEETKVKIFEPFFTTKFTGRGLGMAAVLGIVRGHQGAIVLDTVPGKGSTFQVFFPALEAEAAEVDAAQGEVREAGAQGGRGTILVVDDEETVRKLTKAILKRQGFTPLSAADGREALAVFREHADEITCVLLDLTMPHMTGEACFEALRGIKEDVKVVIISGYDEAAAVERFSGEGPDGFLQKPYSMAALKEKLMEILGDTPRASKDKRNMP